MLNTGTRLGPYEIVAPLGAGGMGEVYRARDTRLDRTVAIKVLNAALTSAPDAKARFEREARAISQLNHPHICTLYDIGQQDGSDFLVMEYLEGETLAQRLQNGRLQPAALLPIAMQIAEALDKAHRAGIAHRDLKPGNVMLTKAGAKLLDFGLAKPLAMAAGSSSSAPLLSAAATLTTPAQSPLTSQGTIVGTVQYMSPEQIEGKEADARSDIFAFGVVLYEMATGKRPFEGRSQIKVASAILEDEPQLASAVQPAVPQVLSRVITRCLAKDPEKRWQSALDLKLELAAIAEAPEETRARVGAGPQRGMIAAILVLAALLGGVAVWLLRPVPAPQPVALTMLPSPGVTFNFSGLYGPPAISPDGTRIVVAGSDEKGARSLFIRHLDRTTLQPLQGTANASYPFWSPDGKQVGFFAGDKLKTINPASGTVLDVCAVSEGRGGTWNERGEIVYGTRTAGLYRVGATGGTPAVLTSLGSGGVNHRFPTFFPDGKHVAYVIQASGGKQAYVVSLDDGKSRTFEGVESNVAFSQGRIFHVRDGALLVQRYDAQQRLVPGAEVVAKPVAYDGQFNYAAFGISASGAVAYEEGSGSTTEELVWVDRSGKEVGKSASATTDATPFSLRISPTGDRAVFSASTSTRTDVYSVPLRHEGPRTRLSLGEKNGANPVWSPAGDRIAHSGGIASGEMVVRASSGLGAERQLLSLKGEVIPVGWTPDGDYIIFEYAGNTGADREVWVAPLRAGETPHAIVSKARTMSTALSPDGKWLAYCSEESGRVELYVIPFNPRATPETAAAAGRWQISTEGGSQPRWSRKGDELFFANTSLTSLHVASIRASREGIESGTPKKLFDLTAHATWGFFDVGPDGKIYMFRFVGRETSPLTLLLNWRPGRK